MNMDRVRDANIERTVINVERGGAFNKENKIFQNNFDVLQIQ